MLELLGLALDEVALHLRKARLGQVRFPSGLLFSGGARLRDGADAGGARSEGGGGGLEPAGGGGADRRDPPRAAAAEAKPLAPYGGDGASGSGGLSLPGGRRNRRSGQGDRTDGSEDCAERAAAQAYGLHHRDWRAQ